MGTGLKDGRVASFKPHRGEALCPFQGLSKVSLKNIFYNYYFTKLIYYSSNGR